MPESLCQNRDGGPAPPLRPVTTTGLDGEIESEECLPSIPIDSDYQHLLTFQWEEHTYMFKSLLFGLLSAPRVFKN